MQKTCMSFINHTMNQPDTRYVMLSPCIKAVSGMPRTSQKRCQEIRLGYINWDQTLRSSSNQKLGLIWHCLELCVEFTQRNWVNKTSRIFYAAACFPAGAACRGAALSWHRSSLELRWTSSGLSAVTQEGSIRLRKFQKEGLYTLFPLRNCAGRRRNLSCEIKAGFILPSHQWGSPQGQGMP